MVPILLSLFLAAPHALMEEVRPLKSTRQELWKALGSNFQTDVSPAARPLLTHYKHQLREAAAMILAEEGDPVRAQRRAAELFDALGVEDEDGMTFAYPNTGTDLVAVTVSVMIPCGSDTSLYLFRCDGKGWRLILARESNGYKDVAGGLDIFRYGVSPPDARGDFFVVTANVNPWCTSNWQLLRFDVLRPAADPYAPRVLFRERRTIFDPYFDGYQLMVWHDGFRLGYDGDQSLDTGILVRDHIERYAVKGDVVRRLPPLAAEPTGFVDEWKELPWPEAARYGGTRPIHQLLNRDDYFSSFDPPTRNEDGTWDVELYVDWEHDPDEWIVFTVQEQGESFRIVGIDRAAVATR